MVELGYKHTEIGVIPENWEVVKLNKYAELINGRAYALGEWEALGIPVIRLQNLTGSSNNYYYSNLSLPQKNYCDFGDLLFMWSATFGPKLWKGNKAIYHYHIWKVETNSNFLDKLFLFHKLEEVTESLKKSSSNGGTMLHITKGFMDVLPIPLPPLTEQQAIAEALSDADAWIASLGQLIAKKRLIKQGAMQQLLTPKEGWEVKKLGEMVDKCTTGKLDANAMVENGEFRFYTCAKNFYYINNYAFDDEALLISGNGANVGYIHYYNGKFNAYQRTYVLTGFKINAFFLKLLLDKNLKDRIDIEVSAGNTPYIKMDTITDMKIVFPPSLAEQTRIATILSDMDAEIESLEQQLGKAQKIKQGMMQELLTGRVRLG